MKQGFSLKKLATLPFTLLALLIGDIRWTSPYWLSGLGLVVDSYRKSVFGIVAFAALLIAAGLYYDSLPKPLSVYAVADEVRVTPDLPDAAPDSLNIQFLYDISSLNQDQKRPSNPPSVARIDLTDRKISVGISLKPAKKGQWFWEGDRHLRFEPESDWPAGTDYEVQFDSILFSAETLLTSDRVNFKTPDFKADIDQIEFYQDPVDSRIRRVIATISFSHQVNQLSLKKHTALLMRPTNSSINTLTESYPFTVSYSDSGRKAYIQSEPLKLPEHNNTMAILVSPETTTNAGGQAINRTLENQVLVPDRYSFFKVSSVASHIVRDQQNKPQQVVLLEFTDDVDQQALLDKLSIQRLPTKGQPYGKRHWNSPREVTSGVRQSSHSVKFKLLPNEHRFSKLYSLVIDEPDQHYLYIRVEKGLNSINEFSQRSFYDQVLRVPDYPREINIVGEGSLLTTNGKQRLSVLTRGLNMVQVSVGRLVKGQINHLVSQSNGAINSPAFNNWNFDQHNMADVKRSILPLQEKHPTEANYFSIDLSKYRVQQEDEFGLFFIEIRGWDAQRNHEIRGIIDKRLVLVSDLGVIVKNNADQSHEIFIQSIASGDPVADSEIELLGKNGLPIFTGRSDDLGHVSLPSMRGFQREKEPTVYLVRQGMDLSFIPYNRSSRQINLSRFDIGGVYTPDQETTSLNAFIFTDRGIYRPGETVNLGMIVKNFDLSSVREIPLELVISDPRHQQAEVTRIKLARQGFNDFQFKTSPTSPTGIYQASLHLIRDGNYRGRQIGQIRFDVEEFQPDTMKIRNEIQSTILKGWQTDQKLEAKITLSNLFGTAAADRKITGRLIIEPFSFDFSEFDDYLFNNPYEDIEKKPLRLETWLPEKRSNADGESLFEIDLQGFREGTYRLEFNAEGFDQAGGRSVTATSQALISPLPVLVGYKADGKLSYINAGSQRAIELIAIDNQLQPVESADLTLNFSEIQKISTLVKQANNTYKYQTVEKTVLLSKKLLEIPAKGLNFPLDTQTPGNYRIEIYDADDRRLTQLTYSIAGFANLTGKIDKSAELQLKLDKPDYQTGELIQMNIVAPYPGAGLISIESDRVHHFKWFKSNQQSTVQTIRIPEGIKGNAYVNVVFVRDIASKEIFTSPLSYAVQPFSIDKSRYKIDIKLKHEKIVRPGKPMEITFQTSKPSRIALFAVNEGILQVAGYQTPNPLGHFLQKRSLQVGTMQMLDLILPEFDLVKALSASGGGARAMSMEMLAQNLNPFVRKTDKPAVFWSGIYDANNTEKSVRFDVPDTFAGELRIMAVAVADSALGSASQSTLVRGPFVISPNLLTQSAPGDEFDVTVGVANIIEGSGKQAAVGLKLTASDNLEIIDGKDTELLIDEGGEASYRFRVRALTSPGAAEIKFRVNHGNEDSTRTASLSIRPASTYRSQLTTGYSEGRTIDFEPQRSLIEAFSEQSISASANPLVLIDGLTQYLETYPHGCTEQVVSQVFPLVGLMTHPSYSTHAKIESFFAKLINKLRERQRPDGGFSFWPGQQFSAVYPSVYVMHFLLEAGQQGIPVSPELFQRGKNFLEDFATLSSPSLVEARTRANAIYLLTRMGVVTTNALIDLESQMKRQHGEKWQKDILAVYMAATYQLLQKADEAKRLVDYYELNSNHNSLDDFHSLLGVDAQYIFLLSRHFPDLAKDIDAKQIHQLTKEIFSGRYNTISAAYTVLALGAYSQLIEAIPGHESIQIEAFDTAKKLQAILVNPEPFMTADYPVSTSRVIVESDIPLYYINQQSGFDNTLPDQAEQSGLEIFREYVDEEGNAVNQFKQGQELTVKIKVRAPGDNPVNNVAIIDLLPGGFEVRRSSVKANAYGWNADYIDIREDRVVYYGRFTNTVSELSYRVKLTASGEFTVPPIYAESMYDRSIYAHGPAGKFVVIARP
ncbi:MAG: putative repeat protein (TIGR01451 family) [Gammaproteobacteria bacterium]|jgi:uncharacterized repeat protein (TIGR01451 family)